MSLSKSFNARIRPSLPTLGATLFSEYEDQYLFKDYQEAAHKLYQHLPTDISAKKDWLILALSEDGLYFADFLAKKLRSDKDIFLTSTIRAPHNKDCVIAMVSETEEVVINETLLKAFDISLDYIYGESHRKYEENILAKVYRYRKGNALISFENRNIILTDFGSNTGEKLVIAIKSAIKKGVRKIILALPIVAKSVADQLDGMVDHIYALHRLEYLTDLDAYYLNRLSTEESVKAFLDTNLNAN